MTAYARKGGGHVRAFEGVSVSELARHLGCSGGRIVRAVRRAVRSGALLLPIGSRAWDRFHVRPGRRAKVHVSIAEAVMDGRVRV